MNTLTKIALAGGLAAGGYVIAKRAGLVDRAVAKALDFAASITPVQEDATEDDEDSLRAQFEQPLNRPPKFIGYTDEVLPREQS